MKPQSDSPTVSKESFKMLLAVAANDNFKLASVDIRAAFLQSRTLDRDVFMLPPPDIRKQGVIWRLKKPLYGLDDTSFKFWLRMKMFVVTRQVLKRHQLAWRMEDSWFRQEWAILDKLTGQDVVVRRH